MLTHLSHLWLTWNINSFIITESSEGTCFSITQTQGDYHAQT